MPVYFALDEENNRIKIGFTRGHAVECAMTVGYPEGVKLKLLGQVDGLRAEEKAMHDKFSHLRIKKEWFRAEKELLEFIEQNTDTPQTLEQLRNEEAIKRAKGQEKRKWDNIQLTLKASMWLPNDVIIDKLRFYAGQYDVTYHEFLEMLVADYERRYAQVQKVQEEIDNNS